MSTNSGKAPNGQVQVAGIDWSTRPSNRAAVILGYTNSESPIYMIAHYPRLDEDAVVKLCTDRGYRVIGVDVPFGWPNKFVDFVSGWKPGKPAVDKPPEVDSFQFRHTDRLGLKRGLSVSADRLGRSAHEWARLCHEHKLENRIDIRGKLVQVQGPTIIEVYPARTLASFAAGDKRADKILKGYKGNLQIRKQLLEWLSQEFDLQYSSDGLRDLVGRNRDDSHLADALLASLTSLMYLLSINNQPGLKSKHNYWRICCPQRDDTDENTLAKEGWIFFPEKC